MKATGKLTILTLAILSPSGHLAAQAMDFSNHSLESKYYYKVGSVHRFSEVTNGIDAVVTITDYDKIKLLEMQPTSGGDDDDDDDGGIANPVWAPTFEGKGSDDDFHFIDFSIVFYANGTEDFLAPSDFSISVHGNDLTNSDPTKFLIEFAQVGATNSTYNGDNPTVLDGGNKPWLSAWEFEQVEGLSMRLGWYGDKGDDDGRSFSILMNNDNPGSTYSSSPYPPSQIGNLPEPSSILLLFLGIIPLTLRRKRP